MRNKKVRQMMVDVERHCIGDISPAWLLWLDGVCVAAGANFLWPNQGLTVSIPSKIRGNK